MANINTEQIADYLKLSRNTVSKALNNSPKVNEKTKQLVLSTAIKMGYKKLNLQDFSVSSTLAPVNNDICLLVHESEMHSSYWSMILKGVEEYLSSQKYRIMLGILGCDSEFDESLPLVLKGDFPAGIIMIGVYSESYYRKIKSLGVPLVTIDTSSNIRDNGLICDTILMTGESCIYDITVDLIKKGYRDIAFVCNPYYSKSILERWNGYRLAMIDNGLVIPPEHKEFNSLNFLSELEDIMQFIKGVKKLPQALVCANDVIANHIIRCLKETGIKVPDDVAVSGFDDYVSEAYKKNELTSVAYSFKELGMLAARQIVFRVNNPDISFSVTRLESHVVFRRSTDNRIE